MATAALCWGYAAGALAVWAMLRVRGERWWPATLLLFSPRWLWATPLAMVLPLAILFGRRWLWLPLGTGIFVLFAMMNCCVPWRLLLPAAPASQSIRIITANLHGREVNADVLDAFVRANQPDVVALQGYTPGTVRFLIQHGWYRYLDRDMLLVTRWPATEVHPLHLDDAPYDPLERAHFLPASGAAICYALQTPGGEIHLVNLHLASPHGALDILKRDRDTGAALLSLNSARRRRETAAISVALRQIGGRVILAGDFNTPSDSPIFRADWPDLNDAFARAGLGFGTSYSKHHTWLRIDHVLSDPGWHCRACRTSDDIGSGHRAVYAELVR